MRIRWAEERGGCPVNNKQFEQQQSSTSAANCEVDLMPSSIEPSMLEMTLVNVIRSKFALYDRLKTGKPGCCYMLIDCSPSLGMLTVNAPVAAVGVISSVQSRYLPIE